MAVYVLKLALSEAEFPLLKGIKIEEILKYYHKRLSPVRVASSQILKRNSKIIKTFKKILKRVKSD